MRNRVAHLCEGLPTPTGPFSDADALVLLYAYRKDPSNVPCPSCGPDTVKVLAFIHPDISPGGYATAVQPEGEYVAALYCRKCGRAVGIRAGIVSKEGA